MGRLAKAGLGAAAVAAAILWLSAPVRNDPGESGLGPWPSDPELVRAARLEGKLVWYTSLPTDAAVAFLDRFKRRYPFLDTGEFYRSTSYRVYSRLDVETAAGKHIADVVEVGLVPAVNEWQGKGWLMRYESPEHSHYPPSISEPGHWAPMRTFPIVMAHNVKTLDPDEAPRRWWDLTDPRWRNAIGVEGADSGTQHLQYYLLKQRLGADFWARLAANRPRAYNGSGAVMNALLSGEIEIALCALSYGIERYRRLDGAPLRGVWPEEGVPVSVAPLAILATAPHPNAAKLFVDWALSREGQIEMTRLVGAYSARADVPPPPGQPPPREFQSLLISDWDAFARTTADFQGAWRSLTR